MWSVGTILSCYQRKRRSLERFNKNIKRNILVPLRIKNVLPGILLALFITVIANCCDSVENEKKNSHELNTLKSVVETTVKVTKF